MFQTLLVVLGFLSFNTWAIPAPFLPRDVSPALPSQRSLQVEIGRSLSKKAALYFPGQPEYKNLTTRWADNITPNFLVTVEVGTEEDVATTVGLRNLFGWIVAHAGSRSNSLGNTTSTFWPSIAVMEPQRH